LANSIEIYAVFSSINFFNLKNVKIMSTLLISIIVVAAAAMVSSVLSYFDRLPNA